MKQVDVDIYLNGPRHERDPRLFGHFLEHFHRQVYGGVYDPDSPLSDATGIRQDVVAAVRKIKPAIIRWPGGCFVSAYHWKNGVGPRRTPVYDKAWKTEEPNSFGTDEFISFCEQVSAEPYICGNAGTGTPEEMSDWVEYCNQDLGEFAARRRANGYRVPRKVKYWSIGNENWGGHEIGAKTAGEWSRYVVETAKMMKRTDPDIELSAAALADLDWNASLLREAGYLLDWISIHYYWSNRKHGPDFERDYNRAVAHCFDVEERLAKTEHILGATGYLGRIRIAFDEWNLRGWCHPGFTGYGHSDQSLLAPNDDNSVYTIADAIFSSCFLNSCMRHAEHVRMANFSPLVNATGAIYTHRDGIVLRPTYHLFDLYANHTGPSIVTSFARVPSFRVTAEVEMPIADVLVTEEDGGNLRVVLTNISPDEDVRYSLRLLDGAVEGAELETLTLASTSASGYNDVDRDDVTIRSSSARLNGPDPSVVEWVCPPRSVTVLKYRAAARTASSAAVEESTIA